jgi:MFS family permease
MLAVTQEEKSTGLDLPARGANWSLALLLAINLFNYVDRQVLASVEVDIESTFHVTQAKMGWAATVFLLSYMVIAPIFGILADRVSRWLLVGIGVVLWSLASGGTGLATGFGVLLLTRCFVGVGEAAYGPVAPTILSDLYPVKMRGQIMSWFYLAIPVGSALGYVLGGAIATKYDWRVAFYAVVPPGLLLGALAFFMKDPRRGATEAAPIRKPSLADYGVLLRTRSYVINTLGMAAMTFAIGGIGFWMPRYIFLYRGYGTLAHVNSTFGAITVVAGLFATLLGGWAGDRLRKKYTGSYFLVSGAAMLVGFPLLLATLHTPFPYAWILVFLSVFCLFFNTGPTNAILANVTHPSIRATGFALNIFVIHLLGDAVSPPLIGLMSDRWGMNVAFTVVSLMILVGGVLWLFGAKHLEDDTRRAPTRLTA